MSDDAVNSLSKKLDRLNDKQEMHNITLARLTVSVEEHVRRTNLLEAKQANDKVELLGEIKPLKDQYALLRNGALVVSSLCTILMMMLTAAHLLGKL